jgi:hypothetical protein
MSARIHFSEDDFARPADPDVVARDQFGNELSVSQDEALWRIRIESKGAAAFAMRPSITQAEQLAEDLLGHADHAEGQDVAEPHGWRAFRNFLLAPPPPRPLATASSSHRQP